MTEKIIYIADDGKEFTDEWDCQMYERECRINPLFESGALVLIGQNHEIVTDLCEAYYAVVRSMPAARALKDWSDDEGYECPCYDFSSGELKTGKFFYWDDESKWVDFNDIRCFYNGLSEIFSNAEEINCRLWV